MTPFEKTKLNKLDKDLEGVEFLRDCVNALNNRNEVLNTDKTPNRLIKEYLDMLNDETEDEKHIFKFYKGYFPEEDE